eukprot:TRINITY_DN40_c0_g2_i1.p1 TRINITY_DN40_c0_g2~~TRINITY_DN40_c0_g2_i1.p1  ORF type:complete len:689 (+),score=262.87 TRINITY_DN40_c0_g2_i1:410-2476(+)
MTKLIVALVVVALCALSTADAAVPMTCGMDVSIRSEYNWRFWHGTKNGLKCDSDIAGVGEVMTLACAVKKNGDKLEYGDTVTFKAKRVGKYVNDGGSDKAHLNINNANAGKFYQFVIFHPDDMQDRGVVYENAPISIRSNRGGLMTYVKVLDKWGTMAPNVDIPKRGDKTVKFRLYRLNIKGDIKDACPKDKAGKDCSGHGSCVAAHCVCNTAYTGERCEHRREEAECSATGDVHFVSLDGARYNLYESGEFLLYADKRDDEGEAVAFRTRPFKNKQGSAVITEITIRRQGHYLKIAHYGQQLYVDCKERERSLDFKKAGKNGVTLENGLRVRWKGEYFVVDSPSQLRVRVIPKPDMKLMDVFVSTWSPRLGSAWGFCGNNDKNSNNDMMPRMTHPRNRNEPDVPVIAAAHIEDGLTYDHHPTNGDANGKASHAFYQCKSVPQIVTLMESAPAKIITAMQVDAEEAKQEEKANIQATTDSIDTALEEGQCKLDTSGIQREALHCCRGVLVEAKIMPSADPAPTTQDALEKIVNDAAIRNAWKQFPDSTPPKTADVLAEYINCVMDMCNEGESKFCDEQTENAEKKRQFDEGDDRKVKEEEEEDREQRQVEAEGEVKGENGGDGEDEELEAAEVLLSEDEAAAPEEDNDNDNDNDDNDDDDDDDEQEQEQEEEQGEGHFDMDGEYDYEL